MPKISLFILIICLGFLSAFGEQSDPTEKTKPQTNEILIDNFDDADINNDPTWWTFDKIKPGFVESQDQKFGFYSLKIDSKAEDYYIGGLGTYIGKDASGVNTLIMSVYGSGKDSGIIRIQLYDDDNNTYQLEQDTTYKPLNDDYLEYELLVNWDGWRTVEIPLSRFVDMNPGIGDDIFNPDQKNGSGGLLHFQMVFLATTEKGSVNLQLDNIKLVKKTE